MSTLGAVVGIAAVALLLLGGCGLLLASILPRVLRPSTPIVVPLLGYAFISGAGHYATAAGFSLRQCLFAFLLLAAAGWTRVILERRWRRLPRAALRGFPAEWVRQANLMDEVWVPSEFNRRGLLDSGVQRPIHTVPLGVDTAYFHPAVRRHPNPCDEFVFLSVFEWGERKDPGCCCASSPRRSLSTNRSH